MRSLSASKLLSLWEQGTACSKVRRALLLLGLVLPEQPLESLSQLTIGQRDAYLLDLRQAIFGYQVTGLVECPNCGDRTEVDLQMDDLRRPPQERASGSLTLEEEGYRIEFRLPTSADLDSLPIAHPDQMKQTLLARCLLSLNYEGGSCSVQTLPSSVIDTLLQQMAQAEPQADVQLRLECSECQHQWQVGFDIVSFLWRELEIWAKRTLGEVHQLARFYGWPEADILALSPWRRQYYIALCQP